MGKVLKKRANKRMKIFKTIEDKVTGIYDGVKEALEGMIEDQKKEFLKDLKKSLQPH